MDSFINSLITTLDAGSFWNIVGFVVPFLAISVLFGLGFKLIRYIIYKIEFAGYERETGYRPTVYRNGKRIY